MSKKTAFIIITILVVLIAGGFLAFYFYTNQGQGNNIIPDNRTNIFPTSPDTNLTPPTPPATGTSVSEPTGQDTAEIPPLFRELSIRPSAGAVAIATSSGLFVRFVEKGTGNVYEVNPEKSDETRLSNTTIPRIENVVWNKNGNRLIARYIKDGEFDIVQSYYAELIKPEPGQTEGLLQGSFLTENIAELTTDSDKNKLFYIVNHSGGSSGIISEFDGTKKSQIFDSPLTEWLVGWPTPSLVALTTKPSAAVPGFLYFLNTKSGSLTRAISGINGLTTLVNPNGSLVLYSESVAGGLALKVYSFKTGVSEYTAIATLPEKCVWSKNDTEIIYCSVPTYLPENTYPDSWYKGLVSFSDDIWEIDATTGAGKLLAKLKELGRKDIDGVNLFLDSKEDYLFLTNKNDSHLWSLKIAD
jgi:hypothetical protein